MARVAAEREEREKQRQIRREQRELEEKLARAADDKEYAK